MILNQHFKEGHYTPEQTKNLEHLGTYCGGWFGWRIGEKIPRNKRGGKGESNLKASAMPLSTALEVMARESWGGVGASMIAAASGLVGIDLDNVITDGVPSSFALEFIEHFQGSYIETSPSGNGLRGFALGDVPEGTPRGSTAVGDGMKVEIYSAGASRFLRCTGAVLPGTTGKVHQEQAAIDWLASKVADMSAASPDKVKDEGNVKQAANRKAMSLDDVGDELAELRPDKDSAEVIADILGAVSTQPRSKLAEARAGQLGPWKGEPTGFEPEQTNAYPKEP